ncbi:MAG: 50S ribosomal protein L24 [Firmicutes bacterium ADurb.Bin193]|nr:MAG: 50S ribosomal protein L24 [Firmicutes bacterium ADurb.Bin193]
MNRRLHIKKGDTVVVLSGKDKGKKGKVLTVIPKNETVIVEGVAMAAKHKKPRRQGDVGGIIHQETAIKACKVMHVCGKCGRPTRIGRQVLESGEIVRVCKHCAEII